MRAGGDAYVPRTTRSQHLVTPIVLTYDWPDAHRSPWFLHHACSLVSPDALSKHGAGLLLSFTKNPRYFDSLVNRMKNPLKELAGGFHDRG